MVSEQDDANTPTADDAIPRNAVFLSDAFWTLWREFTENEKLFPDVDDFWSDALKDSVGPVPNESKILTTEDRHPSLLPGRKANVFLRSEIQSGRLIACVRDPRLGDILQLRREFWLNPDWVDEGLPASVASDFIHGDYQSPGPRGSLIDGYLRPVFILRDDFEAWFETVFGTPPRMSFPARSLRPISRGRTVEAVVEAMNAIWGGPPPAGVSEDMREDRINEWLRQQSRTTASKASIMPRFFGCPDYPVVKRDKKVRRLVVANEGAHFNGILVLSDFGRGLLEPEHELAPS